MINQEWIWEDSKINTLLEQAIRALGELNAFSLIRKQTFQNILHVRSEFENKILTLGKPTKNAYALLEFIYSKPVVTVNDIAVYLQVSHQTANHLIKDFKKLEILEEKTGYQRNRLFRFDKYFKLFIN